MIGALYTGTIASQAATTAKDLMEIPCPSDAVMFIERIWITQTSQDTSENIGMLCARVATSGSGGASTTLRPLQVGSVAAANAIETANTIAAIAGVSLMAQGFNLLSGYLWTPANDDEVIALSPSGIAIIRTTVAPAGGSVDFSYGVTVREIGG